MFTKNRWLLIFVICFFLLSMAASGTGSVAIAKEPGSDLLQVRQAQTIQYSGLLTNPDGKAVMDGKYDFIFSLYDAAENGTLLWTENQSGVLVTSGDFATTLGQKTSLPESVLNQKELWIEVSVRGPGESAFTSLSPRQMISPDAPASTDALTCPHSHFTDYWSGSITSFGIEIDQTGTGDGVRAYSLATASNYAAVYAVNQAASGSGRGVYGHSEYGTGIFASSNNNDGLEVTTAAPFANAKSAIYAHAVDANGVWGVSTSRVGVHGASTSGHGVEGFSNTEIASYFEGANRAGGYIKTNDPTNYYGAVIDGGLRVINGVCDGCALGYIARNSGSSPIQVGDFVAASGIEVDPITNQPIILVSRAVSGNDAVIGVAVSLAATPSDIDRKSPEGAGQSTDGMITQGAYLHVAVEGLTQVRVKNTLNINIGDYLTAGSNGAELSTDVNSNIARVMSLPDENGFVWVMVSTH
jgi:hypothetical protein